MTSASLPAFQREISQKTISGYAEASGDHNPIHTDPAFAGRSQFGGTIAHGMLLLGYMSDVMGRAYGAAWASTGRMRVRFRAPARPGDVVTVSGEVRGRDLTLDGLATVRCVLECRDAKGQVLATGDASVTIHVGG